LGYLPQAFLDQVADALVQLFQLSFAQARNAYAAMLLIPGFGALRFHSLSTPYKKEWNKNTEKYSYFWDPMPALAALASTASPACVFQREHYISFGDLSALRSRLVFCARVLGLYRSVDLANLKRTVSIQGSNPFIKIKRKGQKIHKWERMASLPHFPQISPFYLLQATVAATRSQGKPGVPVFLALRLPYKPLGADAIPQITKKVMERHGIDPKFLGAHSTRGAGVPLCIKIGFSAEEVCKLGKWKGVQSFVAHYQRLGAQEKLGQKISEKMSQWVAPPGAHRT